MQIHIKKNYNKMGSDNVNKLLEFYTVLKQLFYVSTGNVGIVYCCNKCAYYVGLLQSICSQGRYK